MRIPTGVSAAVFVCLFFAAPASATDYFVSTAGADGNPGTQSAPWRSLARVNTLDLAPGDRVLLRAGDTFDGALVLDAFDAGTAAAPVTVTSYGNGRATIRTARGAGVTAHNVAGIRLSNMNVTAASKETTSGIVFYSDLAASLSFVRVENVEVSGFGRDGIEIGSWNTTTGFRDVRI